MVTSPAPVIEPMTAAHAGPVLAIYQDGLDTGNASFETQAPDWDRFDAAHLPAHRYIAADPGAGRSRDVVLIERRSPVAAFAGSEPHVHAGLGSAAVKENSGA